MSAEKSSYRLLIIDGDSRLAEALCHHFESAGYQAQAASTGSAGLEAAVKDRPHLILLDATLPDMDGLEVFRALRDQARTGHIPVMVLAGRSEMMLQNKVLEEGAYDFIEKPLDIDILTLRVRNALRRAEREGLTEPRTGLPTGRLIQERLRALPDELGWTRIDLKIDSFNIFRDLYGFVTANEALRFAGNLIAQTVNELGRPNDFVGHITGSEEFVIVTTQGIGPRLADTLRQRLNYELESFYNFMERDQGYVLVEDGSGGKVQKPLMTAQITLTQGEPDPNAAPAVSDDTLPPSPPTGDTSGSDSSSSAFEW